MRRCNVALVVSVAAVCACTLASIGPLRGRSASVAAWSALALELRSRDPDTSM